jgi:hypothetical protein
MPPSVAQRVWARLAGLPYALLVAGPVYYFAYGANMSTDVLCRRRGLRPARSEAAELTGHRLVFDLRGIPWLEPAFASVRVEQGATVHGVLHELDGAAMQRLDGMESGAYERERRTVRSRTLGELDAEIYVNRSPRDGLRPSRRYLDLLAAGAIEHGLPPEYVRFLNEHPHGDVDLLRPLTTAALQALTRITRLR